MRYHFILYILLGTVISSNIYSQGVGIDISLDNGTVIDLISLVEKESDYVFLYKSSDFDTEKKISMEVKNATIHEILQLAFDTEKMEWSVYERQIILRSIAHETNDSIAEKSKKTVKIEGIVTEKNGNPLPGVSIVVKGKTIGTISNVNGRFMINAFPENDTLQLSFIGMKPKELFLNGRTWLEIQLKEQNINIKEVIAIGYGINTRRDLTGSISKIEGEEVVKMNTTSFDETLQGMAPGVHVRNTSGVPGATTEIKIRGINSINAETDPLWIIDGIPVYSGNGLERSISTVSQNPMSLINPSDILSIEILKDAAATAIYGSRGSSGVILVTTKTGSAGKSQFTVDFASGISELHRKREDIGFLNSNEWFRIMDIAKANSGLSPVDPMDIIENKFPSPITPIDRETAESTSTDWFNQILRNGAYKNINVSASGGSEKALVYASFNYRNDKGVLKNNNLTRYSGRLNADIQPTKRLKTGLKVNLSYTNNDRVKNEGGGAFGNTAGGRRSGFAQANIYALPWLRVYNENDPTGYWNPASGVNLVAMQDRELIRDNVKQYRVLGNMYLDYKLPFINGLSIRSETGIDFIQNNSIFWVSDRLTEFGSTATDRAVTNKVLNFNIFGTYTKEIKHHYFRLLAGTESQSGNRNFREMEGRDITGSGRGLGNPAVLVDMSSELTGEEYLLAYFGRLKYKYDNRLIFGTSFRRDGSSKFRPRFRWGNFTALSGGWIISEENFLNRFGFISYLKIKGSLGKTGNKDIPNNLDITNFDFDTDYVYGIPSRIGRGTKVINIGVPELTWETTNSYDIGFEYGAFDNRLTGFLGYYRQDVYDLLLQAPVPLSTGISEKGIWNNIGDMRNHGLEINLNSITISREKFSWSTSVNFTTNKNKVLQLTPETDRAGSGIIQRGSITKTGQSINTYYIAEYGGVDADKGVEVIYEIDLEHFNKTGETVRTGRLIPATEENCRVHRMIFKNKTNVPTFFGGITNEFYWGNFELNVLMSFAGGYYIYDEIEMQTTNPHPNFILRSDILGNFWNEPGDIAKYPQLTYRGRSKWGWDPAANNGTGDWIEKEGIGNYGYNRLYDKYLHNADYLRLRNIQLGYQLPPGLTKKFTMTHLKIYISTSNLFTLTGYKGYDPENTTWVNNNMPLPSLRSFGFGINAVF